MKKSKPSWSLDIGVALKLGLVYYSHKSLLYTAKIPFAMLKIKLYCHMFILPQLERSSFDVDVICNLLKSYTECTSISNGIWIVTLLHLAFNVHHKRNILLLNICQTSIPPNATHKDKMQELLPVFLNVEVVQSLQLNVLIKIPFR